MGKHLDALPKLKDYQAPWEKKGEDFDPEKGRGLFHYLLRMEAEAKDKAEEIATERDGFKTQLDEKNREGESDLQRITRERDEALAKASKTPDGPTPRELKLEIALTKGLTARQAERLVGTTREELEADADVFLEESGATGTSGDGSGEDGASSGTPRTTPASRLRSPGDPAGSSEPVFDPGKEAEAYLGQRFI